MPTKVRRCDPCPGVARFRPRHGLRFRPRAAVSVLGSKRPAWADWLDIRGQGRAHSTAFSTGSCRAAVGDETWPGSLRWTHRSFAPWLANHPRDSEHQLSTEARGVKR